MTKKPHFTEQRLNIGITEKESEIQSAIIQYLLSAGYVTVRVNSLAMKVHGRFIRAYYIHDLGASKGLPDVLAMKNGAGLLVEVKSKKGTTSDEQDDFREYAALHGVVVLEARSVHEVMEYVSSREHPTTWCII